MWNLVKRILFVLPFAFGATFLSAANASDEAREIIDKVQAKELERTVGVGSYISVVSDSSGAKAVLFHEKMGPGLGYRIVPAQEINKRLVERELFLSEEHQEEIAHRMTTFGGDVWSMASPPSGSEERYRRELAQLYIRASIYDMREYLDIDRDHARIFQLREFGDGAEVVARENYGTRPAFKLVMNDIDKTEKTDGGEFTITDGTLYIDREHYVILGMQFNGVSKYKKETGNFSIEQVRHDYREVGGSKLYLPFYTRNIVNFSDFMSAKERRANCNKPWRSMKNIKRG